MAKKSDPLKIYRTTTRCLNKPGTKYVEEILAKVMKNINRSLNEQDKNGETLLHFCVRNQCGININETGLGGEVIKFLIEKHGANPNIQNKDGNTPLHLASYKEATTVLVGKMADLDITNNAGNTPLSETILRFSLQHFPPNIIEMGNIEIVETLLENRANPNVILPNNATTLDIIISLSNTPRLFSVNTVGLDKITELLKQHRALTFEELQSTEATVYKSEPTVLPIDGVEEYKNKTSTEETKSDILGAADNNMTETDH